MFLIFTDGFARDLVVVLLVTILVGSGVSAALAAAADTYFGDTINGLIGDVGEYDIILHVRKEMKAVAAEELQKYLDTKFNGGTFKEGPTLAGKSNFFIALPEKAKKRSVMENVGSYFQDIPGNSGYTIMLEPRLTLRGTAGSISEFIIEEIEKIPGVRFAFRRGSSVDVVLKSTDVNREVTAAIKELLGRYKVVEVKFPLDHKGRDPASTASDLKAAFRERLGVDVALKVDNGGEDDEMQSLVDTLTEMRRFLSYYTSKVHIQPFPGHDLNPGERLILKGREGKDVVVEVAGPSREGFEGVIVGGDASNLPNYGSTEMIDLHEAGADNHAGRVIGKAMIESPRYNLSYSIEEGIKLLEELDAMTDEASGTTRRIVEVMRGYDDTVAELDKIRETLRETNKEVVSAISGLTVLNRQEMLNVLRGASMSIDSTLKEMSDVARLREETNSMASSVGTLEERLDDILRMNAGNASAPYYQRLLLLKKGLEAFRAAQDGRIGAFNAIVDALNPLNDALREWKMAIEGLAAQVEEMGSLTEDGLRAKAALDNLIVITDSTMLQLKAFEMPDMRQNLEAILRDLESLRALDIEAIIGQMKRIQKSLPRMKDDEITKSIELLDRYIDGQVIAGDKILLLTDGSVTKREAEEAVRSVIPPEERPITSLLAPAVIEPDVRSSVHHILKEVRSTIAALIGIAFTVFILIVDHCQLMALIKHVKERSRCGKRGVWRIVPDGALLYGGGVGALLLTSISIITGGRVPFLGMGYMALIGTLIGVFASLLSERFSPLNEEEVMAGEALGLTYLNILREIVIPSGRPGILYYLNQRRLIFASKPSQ